ncbi:MAG: NADP-dependent oxidoreductase [Actinobacteria bacterium 13_2_20CM_2_71_6]|nr:MAG: NADP-dependent oxidoreductase [Actinobacteria bacterium 13_2_20CM_2_71_6]
MSQLTGREIHLASRPQGWPTPDNFSLVEVPVSEPGPGEVLVHNRFISVDPYMRGRMNDRKSYVPPFQLGHVMDGGAVGEVIASNDPSLSVGEVVLHGKGWREYAVLDARHAHRVDPDAAPTISAYLGALGMPGFTAYVGLLDIGAMKPGEAVFVSSAAGAVGSVAGQIAKLRGASRVIGSAGSAAKVEYLTKLGFDAAFNYRDAPVRDQLRRAAPEGIDVYFDNVGGDHLEAALNRLRPFGRVAMCGAIAVYNEGPSGSGPANLALAIGKRLTLRGFLVGDHEDRRPDFLAEMSGWLRTGQLRADETVVDGIGNAPAAFLGVLRGENIGKMVVRLA